MRLLFLGTAAAEGYPGIFCNCAYCREARALGGRNLRYRSALLVNEDLLLDFGPDLLAAAQRFNLSLWNVQTGLVTHAHPDHFYLENFSMRQKSFTGRMPPPIMSLFGPKDVEEILTKNFTELSDLRIDLHTIQANQVWTDRGYTFTSFRANHALRDLNALFYSIDDGTHSFLYATDTGSFPKETWLALKGRTFDVIILEETLGDGKYDQHMGFDTFLTHAQRMRSEGMLRLGGRFIAHHFSHSGNPTHAKLEEFFAPHSVEVAYDGLEINL